MTLVVNDERIANELIARRQACGADRYDEVWEGVYMMAPFSDNEHQALVSALTAVLQVQVDWRGLGTTFAGANVSDRREDWTFNFRVPDVLVFLKGNKSVDCGTHWLGGPDLAIEVISLGDRSLDKLQFYSKVNTSELLVIDRDPWKLTLYRANDANTLVPVAISSLSHQSVIEFESVGIQMSLEPDPPRIRLFDATDASIIREIKIQVGKKD